MHVHRDTGKVLRSASWIGDGIGIIVLAFALTIVAVPVSSQTNLMLLAAVGGFAVIGGVVAAYLALRRYRRTPLEYHLVCKACATAGRLTMQQELWARPTSSRPGRSSCHSSPFRRASMVTASLGWRR